MERRRDALGQVLEQRRRPSNGGLVCAAGLRYGCGELVPPDAPAQGVEAGGHVRGSTPMLELLERVRVRAARALGRELGDLFFARAASLVFALQ